jgi:hypothetical protein|tara:strand:- start:59818 stop:60351 length:534 start_codon:yes stop_codon:yes gene_type:complete
MRKGGGKSKGNSFERDVCRKLSTWITNGTDSEVFWRAASSGAMATQRQKVGKDTRQHGDITSVDAAGNAFIDNHYIECKFYKDLHVQNIVFGKRLVGEGNLYNIWVDTRNKSIELGKSPLLICRQNNMPEIICLRPPSVRGFFDSMDAELNMTMENTRSGMCVFRFDYFLENAKVPS